MIQSFFLISNSGEILIEKHWRGVTSRSICDFFWDEVNKCSTKNEVPPIITTSKFYLINIYRNDIFLLATTLRETSPLLIIEFLQRVYDILLEYFDSVEEGTIRDNFSTVYQLLEEMMDYGYPLTTEPNALKAMITPPTVMTRLTTAAGIGGSSTVSDILPNGTVSNMPWRKTGVKYLQNEIYLDIIEEIDAIIDKHGIIISTEVNGIIQGNSRLSGVPDLTLTFLDPNLIDDCSFHPCVRYNRFERDKVVSFVPPDGNFELMKYRVHTMGPALPPCSCSVQFSFENNHGNVTITLGVKTPNSLKLVNKTGSVVMEDVMVIIPFSKFTRTANLNASSGTVLFDEATKVVKWNVGKLSSDKYPQLIGSLIFQPYQNNSSVQNNQSSSTLSSNTNQQSSASSSFYNESNIAPVIEVQWKVPMASISGLAVSSLQLSNERYKPYKGVRTVAKSGKFLIRSI